MKNQLDLNFVRAQFPAFSEVSLADQAFFENAGGSYMCQQVIDRFDHYFRALKVQPYYGFAASHEAGSQMDLAYVRLADYLGVDEDEVHIGPSTSQNTFVLAQGLVENWQEGDEVIVTNQDHEANSGAWRRLEKRGIIVREWQVDPETGQLNSDDLASLLTNRTKLVAFPHCSNIVGHINPVAKICSMVRDAGAISCVDGVSAAGHGFADIDALGADIYLFSAYKTFGPHQGVMVIRKNAQAMIPNQSHFFNADAIHKRFVPAGPDHAQVAAMNGVMDYFDAVHAHHFDASDTSARGQQVHDLFRAAERDRLTPLLDYLKTRDDIRLLGPDNAQERVPTVAFTSAKHDPETICRALAADGIMAGNGHFYAARLLAAMGVEPEPGAVRLSFVHYTSSGEVDQLITALDRAL